MNVLIQRIMNQMVQNNPNIAGNPRNQALLNTLTSGNQNNIQQTAENLCQTYGCSVEEAGNMAMDWLRGLAGPNQNR